MSDINFPNTSEGRRARRAEIQRLKEIFLKAKEAGLRHRENSRKLEEAIRNLPKLYPKAKTAVNGTEEQTPLTIIRNIYLHKNQHRFEKSEKHLATTEARKDCFDRIKSLDPLCEDEKKRVLQAVYDFDRAFLKSLIKAMDLCEFSGGIDKHNVAAVIIWHDSYMRDQGKNPTNSQLLALLKEIDSTFREMDGRTLRDICKRTKLPLSPDKRGRPSINSGAKEKRLPN